MKSLPIAFLLLAFSLAAGMFARGEDVRGVHSSGFQEPSWVYRGRGDRYYRDGAVGNAIVEYKKAIIARREEYDQALVENSDEPGSPVYPEVSFRLAEIYMSEGLYDLALLNINNAEENRAFLQIPDSYFEIRYTKAELLNRMKRKKESVDIYESIIQEDDNWKFYSTQSPYEISEVMLNDPEPRLKFGKSYLEVGKLKYESRNYDNAVPYFKMACMYGYRMKESLNLLVDCYTMLDDRELAARAKRLFGGKS